jgi:hypothetical protein
LVPRRCQPLNVGGWLVQRGERLIDCRLVYEIRGKIPPITNTTARITPAVTVTG